MKANEDQIGGKHYRSEYQHWDFVYDMNLDYFEGCATKYVMRRKGNRIEDLQKAKHFLQKTKELGNVCRRTLDETQSHHVEKFCLANKLTVRELIVVNCVARREYEVALAHIDLLINEACS